MHPYACDNNKFSGLCVHLTSWELYHNSDANRRVEFKYSKEKVIELPCDVVQNTGMLCAMHEYTDTIFKCTHTHNKLKIELHERKIIHLNCHDLCLFAYKHTLHRVASRNANDDGVIFGVATNKFFQFSCECSAHWTSSKIQTKFFSCHRNSIEPDCWKPWLILNTIDYEVVQSCAKKTAIFPKFRCLKVFDEV